MAKRRSKSNKSGGNNATLTYPKVISATRDQVYGDAPRTPIQQFESNVVTYLTVVFCVILAEGVFLAGSGFLSAEADAFAMDVVYPLFSPTLGLFLLSSSLYGLWKTGAGRKDGEGEGQ